jgi:hypothetical protein
MEYSKAKLKSNGDRVFPCFRVFWIENVPEKYLVILEWTLQEISFQHILISLNSFMGTPISYQNIVQYFPPN